MARAVHSAGGGIGAKASHAGHRSLFVCDGPAADKASPTLGEAILQFVLIIHEVADYAAWKKVFDQSAGIRKDAGEVTYQVLKYQTDPNRIVHFSRWASLEAARDFFESPRLAAIRDQAGVKSPEFIYLDQLESGSLR
jgi:quinol monooxygenase YgiN